MGIEFETRKETNKLVIWNVGIPRTGMLLKSNTFLVSNCNWCLVFEVETRHENELWSIYLHSVDKEKVPCFPLIVSIRHRGRDLYLSQNGINSNRTTIWSINYKTFKKLYPDIEVVGTLLHFVFDFHLRKPDPGISFTDKSVQTSHKNADTVKPSKSKKIPENHPCLENLSLDLGKLIESGAETDMVVKCGDVSIGAHKMILGARSEVFRTMMQSDMVEGREGIIKISDMEPKILKIFIKYIYTGNLPNLTMDTALPIYEAADKYQVEALKKRSGHLLMKNLSPENALAILVAADAHSDTDLKDQLVSYISEEKIPSRKEEWLKFCNEYPKLGNEVLNFMFFK